MENRIKGVGVAVVTPFDDRGAVDFRGLERVIDNLIDGRIDYLVALGTTAETPTLNSNERASVLACIKERNNGRLPIIVGIGGNNTAEVVEYIKGTDLNGIDAVLSVAPYYNRPSQEGLFQHYKKIAGESPVPILLYNVPARTGVNMHVETTLRLAHEVDNILGVKEACGRVSQMAHILKDRPEGFKVISGDDMLALPLVSLGGDGVISVIANAFPHIYSKMHAAALAGDITASSELFLKLVDVMDACFCEGNPTGVKAAMEVKGLISGNLRLPLVRGSEKLYDRCRAIIEKEGL